MIRYILYIAMVVLVGACASYQPYYKNPANKKATSNKTKPERTILFFGGAGHSKEKTNAVFAQLEKEITQLGPESTVLILGNMVSRHGLPDTLYNKRRSNIEEIMSARMAILNDFEGNVFIVPGNYDWANGLKKGFESVLRLEEFVEKRIGKENVLVPGQGCPGPFEYQLAEDVVMLALNTQWWLHEWDKPGVESGCGMEDELDFIVQVEDALRRHRNKKVIVAGHHPLFSNGPHGGFLPWYTHLAPPVLGSVYALYRKSMGGLQDLNQIKYRVMINGLTKIFEQHPHLVYLSGHERSQQYHKRGDQHYMVSGAVTAPTRVIAGNNAEFAYGNEGYGKLLFYKNGDVYVEFWVEHEGKMEMAYQEKLFNHIYDKRKDDPQEYYSDLDFSGQTIDVVATTKLNKKGKKPGLLGNNYRKEWATEIQNVPVFDIGKEKGGLKIIKKGGGMQTQSLRLEASDGKQYNLRSIEKYPERAVPSVLRGTIAADLVADQVSASHPYGAFVIPPLASAAGVYHTNPKLVYVPDDPRLGKYREDFAEGLYLFEERPDEEVWKDLDSFGNPDDIKSTLSLVEKMRKNDKHLIDGEQTVRSRLFDIWIGDWDRHDDQWRWGRHEREDDIKVYFPIPRDRDQVFFWADGALIKLISHKWGQPKFQGFHAEIRDVAGLEFNARYFDRTFLTEPDKEVWLTIARDLQERLTDEVIEDAIKQFPPEIYALNGETIIRKLKQRRDDLVTYAQEFYLFLAKEVDVLGSDKAELFEVTRLNDTETKVVMYRVKEKSGKIKHKAYERTFKTGETKEIRLYGFGDDDRFYLKGEVNKGLKIRIIGGKGDDIIKDESNVGGLVKKTIVYDNKSKTDLESYGEVKDKTSDRNSDINAYNRYAFKYDKLIPQVTGGFNPDDGVFIGGGVSVVTHKFRKDPFGNKHTITGSIAPKSASYDIKYHGQFSQVIGKWGLDIELDVFEPSYADFFYGFGNNTISNEDLRDDDNQFYRARYGQWIAQPSLVRSWNDERHTFRFSGFFRSIKIDEDQNNEEPNRFIISYPELVGRGQDSETPLLNNRRQYLGTEVSYSFDLTDASQFPTRGVRWNMSARAVQQVEDEENDYQSLASDFSVYYTFGGGLRTTLAVRIGGQANFGNFEFYQAPRLGGLNTLRGYRRERFTGDESFYQNTDIRVRLLEYKTPLFPGSLGITLIHDIGRVWTNKTDEFNTDNSLEDWHRGYGGGIWIAPLGMAVISADYTVSNDDEQGVYVRFGFMF